MVQAARYDRARVKAKFPLVADISIPGVRAANPDYMLRVATRDMALPKRRNKTAPSTHANSNRSPRDGGWKCNKNIIEQ